MSRMFSGAGNFNENITTWDVSNVTDMSYMFYIARKFNQPIGGWNTSSVTDMSFMFGKPNGGSNNIFNQDIGNWDVSNVTNFRQMFRLATLFNQDIATGIFQVLHP